MPPSSPACARRASSTEASLVWGLCRPQAEGPGRSRLCSTAPRRPCAAPSTAWTSRRRQSARHGGTLGFARRSAMAAIEGPFTEVTGPTRSPGHSPSCDKLSARVAYPERRVRSSNSRVRSSIWWVRSSLLAVPVGSFAAVFCAIRYITIAYESLYATFLGFRCTICNVLIGIYQVRRPAVDAGGPLGASRLRAGEMSAMAGCLVGALAAGKPDFVD